MKNIVQIIGIALVLMIIGCKPDATNNIDISSKASNDFSKKNVDINELYQYYYSDPKTQDEIEENMIIDYIIDHDLSPVRSFSGLYYQITEEGSGDKIKPGDDLVIHYTGRFLDGKVFDSSVSRGNPLKFKLGTSGLISGWLEGLRYANEGTKMKLVVPSRLGYQKQGFSDMIAPDTPLAFDMEIIKVN